MSDTHFPAHVAHALDRLTVPPLPIGFGNRLLARIAANDLPGDTGLPLPAKPRLSFVRRAGWRRATVMGASIVALGLATATAAASGVFGEPVYVPVVSDALAGANLVALPVKKPVAHKAAAKQVERTATIPSNPAANGKEAARQLILSKWQDPEFRRLSKDERHAIMQAEIRSAVESGRFSKEDLRAAMIDAQAEKQARNQARFDQDLQKLGAWQRKHKEQAAALRTRYENASPEQQAAMREKEEAARAAFQQLSPAERLELRALRLRLRDAAPQDKPAIRAEMRAFWRRSGVDLRGEGSPPVVR
jgi:hypothetical protein